MAVAAVLIGCGGPPQEDVGPPLVAPELRADYVTIDKSDRQLLLWRDGNVIRSYEVGLGKNPVGHKMERGDSKTPVGNYIIDWRNPNSQYYLSLHISYPDANDIALAQAEGRDPGDMIMIHGAPNGYATVKSALGGAIDWTEGCIAVQSDEMLEIWQHVPDGTPITITE
ncbi:L,D-transpeptidase family protein [Paracoccaceae bacterium GXU_MW_L88]